MESSPLSPEKEHPLPAFGWAAKDSSGKLSPFKFSRRAVGETDIKLKILYCGICHSDLHMLRNEWSNTTYPIVPGHEIVGIVTEVGNKVNKFKAGDNAGIGCIVGSCHECENCNEGLENYCPKAVATFNSVHFDGTRTYGGLSDTYIVDEHYAIKFPESIQQLESAAPLMCGGITVYSPMKYYCLDKPGMRIGVAGLGGLGHLAVKFGKAFGGMMTVISTSEGKGKEAIERLGADDFIFNGDAEKMQAFAGTLDAIIDTASAVHSLQPLLSLLKTNGKLVLVGAPSEPLELPAFPLIAGRKMVAGSGIGGIKETQEMIDFAVKHEIMADVEVIPMDYVNEAMKRLANGDVRYRFVVDVANTLQTN